MMTQFKGVYILCMYASRDLSVLKGVSSPGSRLGQAPNLVLSSAAMLVPQSGILGHYIRYSLWCRFVWNDISSFKEFLKWKSDDAYLDGLVQDCSNSIANALDLLQSCTKPSIYAGWLGHHWVN